MTAVLSTNRRSPDSWDVYAIANVLLTALTVSSKNKSHCVKNRSQRQSRLAAVSGIKTHSLPWLCRAKAEAHQTPHRPSDSNRLNCHLGNELGEFIQLSGDNDQTAATAIHICGYHTGHRHRADMNMGVFLLSHILLHRKDLDAVAESVLPISTALPKSHLPSWMCPTLSTPQTL